MQWLAENILWILVLIGLAAIVGLIIYRLIKNKKSGKSSCGCGCANCAMRGTCHSNPTEDGQNTP